MNRKDAARLIIRELIQSGVDTTTLPLHEIISAADQLAEFSLEIKELSPEELEELYNAELAAMEQAKP